MSGRLTLDARLLAAHAAGDRGSLVSLYEMASKGAEADAAAFFLTQAWVFALETGDPRASALQAALAERGRA
ncbi:hypothetical protein [Jannaschia sp. 2305UL9-9]|uniref:hypothetical protein n=1 Tax=Jannaschia sp. 2305UL9-9 TaxID=3121638 RepID=UPI0035283D67